LHPVVPDRTALGAAIERDAHGDQAQNQYYPAKHERAPLTHAAIMALKSGIFKPNGAGYLGDDQACRIPFGPMPYNAPGTTSGGEPVSMQEQQAAEFGIAEAKRVLGEVFAPWVQDLNLSIEGFDFTPPPGGSTDWQPGAIVRMPFSERLCRNGGIVCGQALMAFADTAMVLANLAANRSFRPMTTVDQTTHFMRAVTASDVLADARVVRLGRTMSFGRVTLTSATDNKPVAMVSSAFAML
jgi:uncharacterized protein (TIGR00369 family)